MVMKMKETDNIIELKEEERTKCEIWTRVMGYLRPVSEYNIGKKSEYASRTPFIEKYASQEVMGVAAE